MRGYANFSELQSEVYCHKHPEKENLYFSMVRITPMNEEFWTNYVENEGKNDPLSAIEVGSLANLAPRMGFNYIAEQADVLEVGRTNSLFP